MIIYKTTNLINGKFYIGKDERNKDDYLGSGLLLNRAIKKYGIENFEKETIETCDTREKLCEREKYWIKELNAQDIKIAYNIADGGWGGATNTGMTLPKLSEERKQQISEFQTGRIKTKETCKKISNAKTGIKRAEFSEEWKLNMSKASKARELPTEWLDQQKPKFGKDNPMYGITHSDETKKKMSESHLKNPVRYWKGKTRSDEAKRKTSETLKNRTPEQLLKQYKKWYITRFSKSPTTEQLAEKLKYYKER